MSKWQELVGLSLDGIMKPMGFDRSKASDVPDYRRGDRVFEFQPQAGSRFQFEVVAFIYCRRPFRSLLVDFVASDHTRRFLCENGFSGNAIAQSLFDYQCDCLGKDPADLLEKQIRLQKPEQLPGTMEKLESEIQLAIPGIWDSLRSDWDSHWDEVRRSEAT